ncbi:pirin family protein [Francisella philomiragia]|uniref:pirin family protein n=1 Tax=Francisella philomiragia TaxID=28110 RepID=UPI001906A8D9|nr:pirin family protein [Francisella philomiragia]MBK2267536.1 pirin family protein [Francisella philomiragia]MBK2278992.1 pirin family protein [Francisella philomiragia]MBK2286768.1 pirin family protein [Francisella philomiragia]MBK2288824.1 pirin family protein [Francisella philomiragia]MBK2290542.1 pirin family protein [Francisella philomiragia]
MAIQHIIDVKTKNLGAIEVRRVLPTSKQKMVGPWIFFDHFGPVELLSGDDGINVKPHPHINLATVTYLFEGEIFHRDSLGNAQPILPGEINLMVAGKGITHSEREREELKLRNRTLHGIQLWHALPEAFEEISPAFYNYRNDGLPNFINNNADFKLLIGDAYGYSSPVKTYCQTLYIEVNIPKNVSIDLPIEEELAIYVIKGKVEYNKQIINSHTMLIIDSLNLYKLDALSDSHIVIIGGDKLSHRFIEWNFVSSNKDRIKKAKDNWKNGRFKKVYGDEEEFIPLP